jgi:hypothetical protein
MSERWPAFWETPKSSVQLSSNLSPGPLIARNAEPRAELLEAGGGTLPANEVGAMLGISRQAVDKRRQAKGLLGLRQGGDWRYPRCQFDETLHEVVAGLPKLLKAFSHAGPWVILDFLLAPDETLRGNPPPRNFTH